MIPQNLQAWLEAITSEWRGDLVPKLCECRLFECGEVHSDPEEASHKAHLAWGRTWKAGTQTVF